MVTYRGQQVYYSVFNRKADTYSLIGDSGETVAELKRHEYLSNPYFRNMEQRSGRHRGTSKKDKRRSVRIASDPGGDDSTTWYTFNPTTGASTVYTGTAARSSRPTVSIAQLLAAMEPKPKPPLKRDGIVAGEIVGYRCWRVEAGLLRSVYQNDLWEPGQVLEGRELGDWDQRGIHAWKDAGSKQYHDYIRSYLNEDLFSMMISGGREKRDHRPAMVTGTVFLWGDVVEHERGWRAEFARVRSLDWLYPDATMMGREQAALNDLRQRYGVTA